MPRDKTRKRVCLLTGCVCVRVHRNGRHNDLMGHILFVTRRAVPEYSVNRNSLFSY